MDTHISRSSILYGTSTSETWHNMEQFQKDHIQEINQKLDILDDEIWGKIILMEKNKRIAKAYLRTTTVIVDGGGDKFDGKTIGFNAFVNHDRDAESETIRWKINEGIAMKMDDQGNILAKANGMSPVFLQGLCGPNANHKHHCVSQDLIKSRGRLEPYDPNREITKGADNKNRIVKIFDMKKFKADIESHLSMLQQGYSAMANRKNLLLKSCVRVSLVKNDERHPLKSPCWFMLVNLVALDMLNAKVPPLPNSMPSGPGPPGGNGFLCQESLQRSQHLSQSAGDLYGTLANPGVITSAAAAAASPLGRFLASQAGAQNANPIVSIAPGLQWGITSQQDLQSFGVNDGGQLPNGTAQNQSSNTVEHLAALANSLALGFNSANASNANPRSLWKPASNGYLSETENSAIGNAAAMIMHRSRQTVSTEQAQAHTSAKLRPINQQCPGWGMAQSMDSLYEPIGGICISGSEEFDEEDCPTSAAAAAAAAKHSVRAKSQKGKKFEPSWSNGSASDYESTKDIYDSSISSSSSRSSNSANGRSSPSIVSETASEQTSESGYVDSGIQRCIRLKKDGKEAKSSSSQCMGDDSHGSRHIALVTVHQPAKGPAPPPPRLPVLQSPEEETLSTEEGSPSVSSDPQDQSSEGSASPVSSTTSGEDVYSNTSTNRIHQQTITKMNSLMRRPSRDLQAIKVNPNKDRVAVGRRVKYPTPRAHILNEHSTVPKSSGNDSQVDSEIDVYKRSPPIAPHRRRKLNHKTHAPQPIDSLPSSDRRSRPSSATHRPSNKTVTEVWNF